MNRAQRIVFTGYCLLVIYCCLWIPWHLRVGEKPDPEYLRVGYGWLWVGPHRPHGPGAFGPCDLDPPGPGCAEESRAAARDSLASPDLTLIALRLAAATGIAAAVFLLAGFRAES